ncbi:23 kDa integral membrane protein-like isoform X2 [Ornithodoros turicata]|uniref:Tetraspanin n=2 Tax=Ornithodoros turicata TaxID=34597 RepID=A0A2R5L994_9ACAR
MAAGLGLLKAVLCVLNIGVVGLGVGAIVVGALVLSNPNLQEVKDNLEQYSNYSTAAGVALAAGVVVILFGLCGCCGACFAIGWLLILFVMIMAALVVVEMTVMGLVWKYTSGEELEKTLTDILLKLIEARKSGLPNFLHEMQLNLNCCGARGPDDYARSGLQVPQSCYNEADKYVPRLHDMGCGKAIAIFLGEQSLKVGLVTLGVVLAQILAISIAILLYCKL